MCSWGHVAKNSTACSHEWRAHSTIALVFSTKAWHGQKRSSSGHGHKCQGGGVQSDTNTGLANCEQHLRLRPHLDRATEPPSSAWTLGGKCHMERAKRVSWHPVFCFVAQQHPCLFHEVFTSMQRWPSMLESSYSSPSMTQKQHLVPPDWSHE